MQMHLLLASGLAVLVGLVHSLLGEYLIFRHLRRGSLVPALDAPPLRARHVRILWATWHLGSVFGWAFAAVLLLLARQPEASPTHWVLGATVGAYAVGACLVLVGTRGRHPGWIALAVVAVLVWLAMGRG